MQYEVEQKFPVADMEAIQRRLAALGAAISEPEEEVDLFFAHPARDFAATDEALRLRQKGGRGFVTYKGPKIDAATKTRRELELPLGDAPAAIAASAKCSKPWAFGRPARCAKLRRKAWVEWQGRRVEVSLDTVEGLGTFVELELMAGPAELDAALACLAALAPALGLTHSERRSYLQLRLERT